MDSRRSQVAHPRRRPTTYDRSKLIDRSIDNLQVKLTEEFIAVAVVCAIFLFHLRSAFVAVVTLPVARRALGLGVYFVAINGASVVGIVRGTFGKVSGVWTTP